MNDGRGELDKLTQDADRKRVASSRSNVPVGVRPQLLTISTMAARLSSRFTRFYRNITTSSTSNHLRWNCTTNSTNLTRKLARTSTIPLRRTKPITLSSFSFCQPKTSTQASLRRFSTSRTFLQRKYVRFQVDPEAPLDYRRWNPGTQVAVGLVVMGASYYFYQ